MDSLYEIEYLDVEPKEIYTEIVNKVVEECFKTEHLLESKMYISIT